MLDEKNVICIIDCLKNKSLDPDQCIRMFGQATYDEAAKRLSSTPEGETLRQMLARHANEKRNLHRLQALTGVKTHRASQTDHQYIIDFILKTIQNRAKTNVSKFLCAYGKENGKPDEWAQRVKVATRPRFMRETLSSKKDHPVFVALKASGMLTQTHKGSLVGSTYSGFAQILDSSYRLVMEHNILLQEIEPLKAQLKHTLVLQRQAAAQLTQSEEWKCLALKMHNEGASFQTIASTVGKGKSTVHEYIQRAKAEVSKSPSHNIT